MTFPARLSLVSLLAATSLALSGCYLDHRPNATIDDKFNADELTRRELDGVKVRAATLAEFGEVTGVKSDAVAFDLKLSADDDYRVYLLAKNRSGKVGEITSVDLLRAYAVKNARKAALVAVFSGVEVDAHVTGAEVSPLAKSVARFGDADASVQKHFPEAVGVNLPAIGEVARRFVVRRLVLDGRIGAAGKTVEIECVVVPVGKDSDEAAARENLTRAVKAEWAAPVTK